MLCWMTAKQSVKLRGGDSDVPKQTLKHFRRIPMKPVQAGRLKVTAAPSIRADDEGGNACLTQLGFWCRTVA